MLICHGTHPHGRHPWKNPGPETEIQLGVAKVLLPLQDATIISQQLGCIFREFATIMHAAHVS